MTEYIVEVDDKVAEVFVERFDWETVTLFGHHLVGEIVRCRDCEHYDPHPTDGGVCFLPDGDGGFAYWEVEPDGYCKWGERRQS